jgi:hypothetical protein
MTGSTTQARLPTRTRNRNPEVDRHTVALDHLDPLADVWPDKFDRAAVRWHGRLEIESTVLTIAESHLALAALGAMRGGDKDAGQVLRRLLRRGADRRSFGYGMRS